MSRHTAKQLKNNNAKMLFQDGVRTQVTESSKELVLPAYFGLFISSSYKI